MSSYQANPVYIPINQKIADAAGDVSQQWALFFQNFTNIVNTLEGNGLSIVGTHAERLQVNSNSVPPGTIWIETDRSNVAYVAGSKWSYAFGICVNTLANQPVGLGVSDAGLLYGVADFNHLMRWTGTLWNFALGDAGGGFYQDFVAVPTNVGWVLCDGSTTTYIVAGGITVTALSKTLSNVAMRYFRR